MKRIVFLSVVFSVAIASCKKYDEGSLFSMRSAEKRICRKWTLTLETRQNYGIPVPFYDIEFKKGGVLVLTHLYGENAFPPAPPKTINGTWSFTNRKKYIVTTISAKTDTLEVLRLTTEELWLYEKKYKNSQSKGIKKYTAAE